MQFQPKLWDKMCRSVEGYNNPAMVKMMGMAKLFIFSQSIDTFLPQNRHAYLLHNIDSFRLPFPIVAVQNSIGNITIIADTVENQVGFNQKRIVLDFLATKNPISEDGCLSESEIYGMRLDEDGKITMNIDLFSLLSVRDGAVLRELHGEEIQKSGGDSALEYSRITIYTVLQELIFLMEPQNFILKESPQKIRPFKNKKIPRQHERPLYTFLKPNAIRERMGVSISIGNGTKKRPHERRGHWRVLRNERYGDRVGEQIWVKHSWIGPSEAKVGNKFYKVILEL